jgi:hypothetical protein
MQTARVTILMTPERKKALEVQASRLGVSSGEYIRLAVDNFAHDATPEQELAALTAQLDEALPAMRASLDRSTATLEAAHRKIDALLREAGVRK